MVMTLFGDTLVASIVEIVGDTTLNTVMLETATKNCPSFDTLTEYTVAFRVGTGHIA
jgi:hypothetical protein